MGKEGSHSSLDICFLEQEVCGSLEGDWELLEHSVWHREMLERGRPRLLCELTTGWSNSRVQQTCLELVVCWGEEGKAFTQGMPSV